MRLREDPKWAGVYGHVGYLIDRPAEVSASRAEDMAQDRRPYLVRYFPTTILDWEFRRESGHMNLIHVKLLDSYGSYRLWWRDRWEVWRISEKGEPVLEGSGTNAIGAVPFAWLYSTPAPDIPGIGLSDMRELARFDLSIMGAPGSGGKGGGQAPPSNAKASDMTLDQKLEFIETHGKDAYENLVQAEAK